MSSEEEFIELEVERIIKTRINKNGVKEYRLKWRGYPNSRNTWEVYENLNCPKLLRDFETRQKKKNMMKVTGIKKTRKKRRTKQTQVTTTNQKEKKKLQFVDFSPKDMEVIGKQIRYAVYIKSEDTHMQVDSDIIMRTAPSLLVQYYNKNHS